VHKNGQPAQTSGKNGRNRGKTAHPQNRIRLEARKQTAALQDSPGKTGEELHGLQGDAAGQPHTRKTRDFEFRAPFSGNCVDVFFRRQQEHPMPPSVENFSDGQPRKKVPTRAARSYRKTLHAGKQPQMKGCDEDMDSVA
jgi:hypothetical protein